MKNYIGIAAVIIITLSFTTHGWAGIADGLKVHYSFAGNADNQIDHKRDGNRHGAALSTDRHGRANNAYSFDGLDDWIGIDDFDCLLDFDHDWSVNVWVNLSDTGRHINFFAGADGDAGSKQFSMASMYVKLSHKADTDSDWRVNFKEVSHDSWHMYTATWSKNGHLKAYVDGVLQGEDSDGELDKFCPKNEPILGGVNFYRKSQFFKGGIDDFRIYDRVLAEGEIRELFTLVDE